MTLKEQLTEDMKQAMRARDMFRLGTIRYVLSEIKNAEIDHGPQTDEQIQKLLTSQIKKMKDAIEDFKKGNREDLIEEEQNRVNIIQSYLPQQLSDEELKAVVEKVIAESGMNQVGPLTGKVMQEVKGLADGGRVSAMIQSCLAQ